MSDVSQAKTASTATFVTALVFNSIVFAAEIAVFTIIRPRFKAIYEPRTYAPIASKRCQPLSKSIFAWPMAIYHADYKDIINANGMDAYFFVRFLRMMVRVFLPIWFLSWAVLLPVTSVKSHVPGVNGLDRFTFGNVENTEQDRYAAHIICVYIFTGWIYYNIKYEMRHFVTTRQRHLIEPVHAASVQANTLLITGVPVKYLSENALTKLFNHLPGGVKKVWINRDLRVLPAMFDRRLDACAKLESAEVTLLGTATKLHFKRIADAEKAEKKGSKGKTTDIPDNSLNADVEQTPGTLAQLVPRDKRPMHRIKPSWAPFGIPCVGEKVDTIEWCREEIRICDEFLEKEQALVSGEEHADKRGESDDVSVAGSLVDSEDANGKATPKMKDDDMVPKEDGKNKYPAMNSAFVTFNQQIAAHMGLQVLTHHEPYRMAGKYTEVSPEDVIWSNLGMNPYEQKVRLVISYSITAALIIFWALPVAAIAIISNVHALCAKYSWLAWICALPPVVVGIISGILPPLLLLVLMMLLPIILRLLARFEGIPKKTGLELSLMTRFFIFQVIHSFLIVTLVGGIITALPELVSNPTSVPNLLAKNLPAASTFFLTYILLQGLSGTAGGFLRVASLVVYYLKLTLLGSTPRSVHGIKYGLDSVAWGTLFPTITLLTVIALGYSIISPLVNGFACAAFFAFYFLYKYLFLYVIDQPPSGDTGGLFFPKAIQHIFVGLYVQQVCLCALFFLARNQNNKPSAIAEGALMVVLIVLTFFFQMLISNSYGPLIHSLPLTLADLTYKAAPATGIQEEKRTVPLERSDSVGKSRDFGTLVPSSDDVNGIKDISRDKHAASVEHLEEHLGVDPKKQPMSEEDYGFAQPAASRPQRIIWLPLDPLGLVKEEVRANREAGVEVAVQDATMNEKGKVDVSGPPPEDNVGREGYGEI